MKLSIILREITKLLINRHKKYKIMETVEVIKWIADNEKREKQYLMPVFLIEEKDFQKITIHEIAERADINRGTFYLHFLDKYDMMDHFENEMIEKSKK